MRSIFSYTYYKDFSLWLGKIINQTSQGSYPHIYNRKYSTSKITEEHCSVISITAAILF